MEIAVTGACVLSSAGETALALYEHSLSGKAVTQQIDILAYEKELASINTGPRELYRIHKLLLIAFLKASRMAGLQAELASPERTGIFLGNSYGIEEFKTEFFRLYKKTIPVLTSPTLFPFTTANALGSWLAIQTGAKGPSLTFVSGSNSSAEAIHAACDALTAGECDTAFVGAASFIDNNLSDEFYTSGFKYETAGMLVLEKMDNVKHSNRKPLAIIKDRQSATLSQEQLEAIRQKQDVLSAEIIYLGNDLGDDFFSYSKNKTAATKEARKVLFLSDMIGNVFDAAGVVGIALSIELLKESILYSNVSSSGSVVTTLISRG